MSEIKVEVNGENFTPIGVSGSSTMMANLASALRLAAALVLVIEKLAEARRVDLDAVVGRDGNRLGPAREAVASARRNALKSTSAHVEAVPERERDECQR